MEKHGQTVHQTATERKPGKEANSLCALLDAIWPQIGKAVPKVFFPKKLNVLWIHPENTMRKPGSGFEMPVK